MKPTLEQIAVAENREDRLLVRALAGTGKTEAVAQRSLSLVDDYVDPEEILITTFTRSARSQIRARLRAYGIKGVRVDTLHAVALSAVREAFERRGKTMPTLLSDGGNSEIRIALNSLGLPTGVENVDFIKRCLAGSASEIVDIPPTVSLSPDGVVDTLDAYRELKVRNRLFDFNDLFDLAVGLDLPTFTDVIVDEAQDLTYSQKAWCEALDPARFVLVGDPNQSIYGFAGVQADVLDLHDWDTLTLTKSFRSGLSILKHVNDLIPAPYENVELGGKVAFRQEIKDPANVVASLPIRPLTVLARTRAELEKVRLRFEKKNIPVHCAYRGYGAVKNDDPQAVRLQTIHSAKGGEWENVAVLGLGREGFRSAPVNGAEERRLLYVAATRAKESLVVLYLDGLPFEWSEYET